MSDEPSKPKDPKNPSGPFAVRTLRIKVDRDLCIGAATCAALATKTFQLDDEQRAIVLETAEGDTDESIIEAARACPVAAIIIENEKGEKVYPK